MKRMNNLLRTLALATAGWLAGFSLSAFASPYMLQPFSLQYHARYMGLAGQGTLTLQAAEHNQWRYTLHVQHAVASLTQSTLFDEQGTILRPLSSHNTSRIPFRNHSTQAHYDWDARLATWSGDVKPSRQGPVPLEPGDLNGLLINLAVVRDVAQGQRLHYRMVDSGRAVTLEYQIIGTETVTLDGKPVQANRIERSHRNKQQIAWVVPGIPAPVRLLQRENGKDVLELSLLSGTN